MGCCYTFQCPACGYKAEVSGGGDDGLVAGTTTIVCHDRRELLDITTGYHQKEAHKKAPPFRCPKGKQHRIEEWKAGGNSLDAGR